ncbi:hypothetical protein SDC9_152440 [bioreactor metagenome]|uniref:Uncharacterized protein n=1 Tax=bioreactor metagenome TaxID=1076179 RepID=A0A645EUQ5_9ZZZZ
MAAVARQAHALKFGIFLRELGDDLPSRILRAVVDQQYLALTADLARIGKVVQFF